LSRVIWSSELPRPTFEITPSGIIRW